MKINEIDCDFKLEKSHDLGLIYPKNSKICSLIIISKKKLINFIKITMVTPVVSLTTQHVEAKTLSEHLSLVPYPICLYVTN